ncbi:MAG: hypothetical protein HYV08_01075, partial [Deltaproteobacteria bacterium]|nr:hypothetical protein [Deltaproteobacteria bacterium]
NATALPTDKTYVNQIKAGQILEKIFAQHPGWAHYLIHSYDSPPLASRGLTAARVYAKIAPASPHALHMPSHIFTRLGLWQESIQSNRASADAAKADDLKVRPGVASSSYMHALDYMAYAYLQGAQDREAKEILEEVMAVQKAQEVQAAAYAFAAVPARYAIERRRWSEAAALLLRPTWFPWSRYRMTEAITYFARGLGAARSGDAAGARKEVEKLQAVRDALIQAKSSYWADQVEVQRRAVAGWAARAEGKNNEALALLRAAADLEDSMEKHPVTPGPIVPARELLGEL